MIMQLPPLKPRANSSVQVTKSEYWVVPQAKDWESQYELIQQLYVYERRKLRYVIKYMEQKYRWRASEQMYKKKFAKWGFAKNTKHATTRAATGKTHQASCKTIAPSRVEHRCMYDVLFDPVPGLVRQQDNHLTEFLLNVRIWTMRYYSSADARSLLSSDNADKLPLIAHKRKDYRHAIGCTFKLVIDLLERGHGRMAGRVARKAFLLVEDMFTLEPPALLWNLLELMHHMLVTNQAVLFDIMLNHLSGLVKGRWPTTHPIPTILRVLRSFLADLKTEHWDKTSCPTTEHRSPRLQAMINALSPFVASAWTLNADILFDHFDTRLFKIYTCIHWYSCSIPPPPALLRAAKSWFEHEKTSDNSNNAHNTPRPTPADCFDLAAADYSSTPTSPCSPAPSINPFTTPHQKHLYTRSVALLRARGAALTNSDHLDSSDPTSSSSSSSSSAHLLPILAGLVCAKVLELIPLSPPTTPTPSSSSTQQHSPTPSESSSDDTTELMTTSQLVAGVAACTIRTLMEIKETKPPTDSTMDLLDQLRYVIALRSYAHGDTNPQTMLEMLTLRDELVSRGEWREAQEVETQTMGLLEVFVREIPVDAV